MSDTHDAPDNNSGETSESPSDSDPKIAERRKFLARLTLGLGALSAVSVGWAVTGYVVAPTVHKPRDAWRKVGAEDNFTIGETKLVTFEDTDTVAWSGEAGRTAAYLRRDAKDQFTCFSINCTHLGCPVRWEQGSELFMCPCHGGVYYMDGSVAAGPPPQPLPRYQVRISNGQVEVQASAIPITRGL